VKTASIVRGILALGCALVTFTGARAATPTAPPLHPGDVPATVTINERPLSYDTDHVIAFKRGREIYVCLMDIRQMINGQQVRHGNTYIVHSFRGDTDSRTYVFKIGSAHATAHGQPVTLHAPVVEAYGHVYLPLSFFEADALVTHVLPESYL
jgi:hypothetical protein